MGLQTSIPNARIHVAVPFFGRSWTVRSVRLAFECPAAMEDAFVPDQAKPGRNYVRAVVDGMRELDFRRPLFIDFAPSLLGVRLSRLQICPDH